jgi:hypothetical protein
MGALLDLPPARRDPFPEAAADLGLITQSEEGRKVREAALVACRDWQERTEVLPELDGTGTRITGRPQEDISEQRLADPWELRNQRRLFLINKKFHSPAGLCAAEEEELRQLQADFESYLDSARPLPNQVLDEVEALAEQLEAEDKGS